MKTRHFLSLLLGWLPLLASAQPDFGQARLLSDGWRFQLTTEHDSTLTAPTFDDSRWQRVSVPHDWGVTQPMSPDCGSCQGYLPGGMGWYRHTLDVTAYDLADGRKLYIYFEGVYNRSTVYVNGHRIGYRPSGFASFLYDLTPYLHVGDDNVIAVHVDHSRQNDSRWYTGSGIYRPVWLVSAPATHLALWGTSWKVKSLNSKKAVVEVKVESPDSPPALPIREGAVTSQDKTSSRTIQIEIIDADGNVIASSKSNHSLPYREAAAKVTTPSLIGRAGGESVLSPSPPLTSGPSTPPIYIRYACA